MMFSKYTDVKDSNDAVLDIFQAIYMFVRFYQIKLTVESDTSTTIAWALYVEVRGSSISFLMRSRCCPHEFKKTFVVHVHAEAQILAINNQATHDKGRDYVVLRCAYVHGQRETTLYFALLDLWLQVISHSLS